MNFFLQTLPYIMELLITSQYIERIYKRKYNFLYAEGVWLLLYFTLFLISFLELPAVNIIGFVLGNFCVLILLYNVKLSGAIYQTLMLSAIMCASEMVPIIIYSDDVSNYISGGEISIKAILAVFFSKLIYFVGSVVMLRIYEVRYENKRFDVETLLSFLVPVLSVLVFFVSLNEIIYKKIPQSTGHVIAIIDITLVIINLIVFWEHGRIQKNDKINSDLQILLQKRKYEDEYAELLIKQDKEQKVILHDMKKHISSIKSLYEHGDIAGADKYVLDVLKDIEKSSINFSNNSLFNILLNHYYQKCKDLGIVLFVDIRKGALDYLDGTDITSIVGNLLENAIEAILREENEDGNVGYIDISAFERIETQIDVIVVKNTCYTNPYIHDGIISSKLGKGHGYGIKSIRRSVKKYEGNLRQYYDSENKEFHSIVILNRNKNV